MDFLTPAERSARMARVRAKDTKPELVVRRLVHRLGYRFRLHRRDLPGTPDLVFSGRSKVVFVHGCFWHGHDCRPARVSDLKASYWSNKLRQNVERDQRAQAAMLELGWSSLVIWECELRNLDFIAAKLREFLGAPGKGRRE